MVGGWWWWFPSDYLVSTQLLLWLFCFWGCGCCWAMNVSQPKTLVLTLVPLNSESSSRASFFLVRWFKDRFGVSSYRLITCFLSFALFLLYHVALSSCVWWVGGSQRLLSLNPTTVLVVLLLGLWLLLGCDNKKLYYFHA